MKRIIIALSLFLGAFTVLSTVAGCSRHTADRAASPPAVAAAPQEQAAETQITLGAQADAQKNAAAAAAMAARSPSSP
jgi:hypothetical protein